MKKLAAIIIAYRNRQESLERLISSLYSSGLKESQIFIQDNTRENLGYAGGINKILKRQIGRFDMFLVLNPDIFFTESFLPTLLTLVDARSVGVIGPKILQESGKIWSRGGMIDKKRFSAGLIDYEKNDDKKAQKPIAVDFVSGTAILIKGNVFSKIGLFVQDYFLYYEDVDFCVRAKKAGFRVLLVPQAKIIHYASSSVGKNSPMMRYYMARNHLLFTQRFAPRRILLRELFRLPKTVFEHIVSKDTYAILGIRDYILRRFGRRDYWS